MDILVDPRNKSVKEFLIFLKIQDGCCRSKIELWQILGSKITFHPDKRIPFIWLAQKLAWTSFLTLETSSKSRMAARGRNLNLRSICWAKMWFVGSNMVIFLLLTNGGHFELIRKCILVIISRVSQYVQAKFCPTGWTGSVCRQNVFFAINLS